MKAVVLDACVLANFALCDTLLRLAEVPRLFEPRWSDEILREAVRTLPTKLRWPPALFHSFESELRGNFAEALVVGYEPFIDRMENDAGDRHVLAAAVYSGAAEIVTLNLRHFRPEHLASWRIRACHPQSFLAELLQNEPDAVLATLRRQGADRSRSLADLLQILNATVPEFVEQVRAISK
jgi:hypothetical protein